MGEAGRTGQKVAGEGDSQKAQACSTGEADLGCPLWSCSSVVQDQWHGIPRSLLEMQHLQSSQDCESESGSSRDSQGHWCTMGDPHLDPSDIQPAGCTIPRHPKPKIPETTNLEVVNCLPSV